MHPDFESVRLKLDRAAAHLGKLIELGQDFLKTHSHRFEHEFNPNLRGYYIWIVPEKEPPPELSILVGDFLYNCASALDHIICAIAKQDDPTNECEGTQFPIFITEKGYRKREASYLAGVPEKARAVINGLQPYLREAEGEDPRTHVLAMMQSLYNVDKHRRLNVALSAVEAAMFRPSHPAVELVGEPYAGPIRGRTKLATFAVPWSVEGQVRVDCDVNVTLGLEEGTGLWPDGLTPWLGIGMQSIHYWIKSEVLTAVEKCFDSC